MALDLQINGNSVALYEDTTIEYKFSCSRPLFWAKLKENPTNGENVGVIIGWGDDWHMIITDVNMSVNSSGTGSYLSIMQAIQNALQAA